MENLRAGLIMIIDYDPENKTLFIRWGEQFHISEGHDDYILDLNEKGQVIGIELLHFDIAKLNDNKEDDPNDA